MTQSELKSKLHYDPETGIFTRISSPRPSNIGKEVGSMMKIGYMHIWVNGDYYYSHRLAFLYMTGVMPKMVDHINHERADNRWANLRSVTKKENNKNIKLHHTNISGHCGVHFEKSTKKWMAYITSDKKWIFLGRHINKYDAIIARREAEKQYGFHPNHGAV